jgi:Pyocin activator protein PrtN
VHSPEHLRTSRCAVLIATLRDLQHTIRCKLALPALLQCSAVGFRVSVRFNTLYKGHAVNNTYFGLLAEFGEANILLAKVAPKYFGLSFEEARRRAPTQLLPCRVFRLGGQKSPWLVSATDLAELIDRRRDLAGKSAVQRHGGGGESHSPPPAA